MNETTDAHTVQPGRNRKISREDAFWQRTHLADAEAEAGNRLPSEIERLEALDEGGMVGATGLEFTGSNGLPQHIAQL